jgi:hypothetical protein
MAARTHAPLTVLYLLPPDLPGPPLRRPDAGHGAMPDPLRVQVAACVAAVGHRLQVASRSAWLEGRPDDGTRPALVLWGLAPGESHGPAEPWEALEPWERQGVEVVPVAPDGAPVEPGVLRLPAEARALCRRLALAAAPQRGPALALPALPGRTAVVVHDGAGPDGDAGWPGLAWALTLLLAGPGRGVLVDLQGADGSLSGRLRALAPAGTGRLGWDTLAEPPVPGPALAARLPEAAGVRWWGWVAGPMAEGGDRGPGQDHRPDPGGVPGRVLQNDPLDDGAVETCLDVAGHSLPWVLLDVGRNRAMGEALAARGHPLIRCRGQEPDSSGQRPVRRCPDAGVRPADGLPAGSLVLEAVGSRRGAARAARTADPGAAVAFRAADWTGPSLSSWARAVRRRSARTLGAQVALHLAASTTTRAQHDDRASAEADAGAGADAVTGATVEARRGTAVSALTGGRRP